MRILQRDLKILRELQRDNHELGGLIKPCAPGEVKVVHGDRTSIGLYTIPRGCIQFHTHPCIPARTGRYRAMTSTTEYALARTRSERLGFGERFPINIVVQPVSDNDLSTFREIVVRGQGCAMLVAAPEGLYVLTMAEATPAPDGIAARARKYLLARDDVIVDLFDHAGYSSGLARARTDAERRRVLERFQAAVGRHIPALIAQFVPEVGVRFYAWSTPRIDIPTARLACTVRGCTARTGACRSV